jgi:hypothetical protein
MNYLKAPVCQKSEALYLLLVNKTTTILDIIIIYSQLCATKNISKLRNDHGVNIVTEYKKLKNKRGATVVIAEYHIPAQDRKKAIEVYNQLLTSKKKVK